MIISSEEYRTLKRDATTSGNLRINGDSKYYFWRMIPEKEFISDSTRKNLNDLNRQGYETLLLALQDTTDIGIYIKKHTP
jgi:hypothetical protein